MVARLPSIQRLWTYWRPKVAPTISIEQSDKPKVEDIMIYNQNHIPKNKWRYGPWSSALVGCGWVATYNALCLLGDRRDPGELIDYYERQLPLINGTFGTQFWGPYRYFKSHGYETRLILDPDKYDALAGDVNILFYHWRSGIRLGAHFVCIQRTENGFLSFNTYKNSTGPANIGASIRDFATKKGHFMTALITIKPGS